jgi:hypothetical protein
MKSLALLNKQNITAERDPAKQPDNETSSTLGQICTFLQDHYTFQLDEPTAETTTAASRRLSECVAYLLRKNNGKVFIRLRGRSDTEESDSHTFKLNANYICKKLIQQQQQLRQMEQMASNGNHSADLGSTKEGKSKQFILACN